VKTPLFNLFLPLLLLSLSLQAADPSSSTIYPYFSPNGGCTQAIVDALGASKSSVLVQAYSFTSAPIAKALVEAHKRHVDVQVILDKSQRTERYSGATFLSNEGIPVFIDSAHKIAHNKIMIVDGKTVITGSFNFTKSAEEGNAENLLVISNAPELAQKYTANWKEHLEHSEPYRARN
jgi:hypothetical protein